MPHPLFNLFSSPQPQKPNMFQQFQQFMNNFKGNPQQKVQELLQNGQMTQDQFKQYSDIANQLTGKRS